MWTGFCTGLSLLWEHPARHSELLLYVGPRAAETSFNLLQHRFPAWYAYASLRCFFFVLCDLLVLSRCAVL